MQITCCSIALTRWARIDLIRELSSAAQEDGGELGSKYGSRFARGGARVPAAEMMKRRQEKAQEIFDKQVRVCAEV